MSTYYYLYKITNNINNKIYIGVHKTSNMDDGYMGSGKLIKAAIAKYGVEYFIKDVITFFDSEDEMYLAESEIVTEEFLSREDVYNLALGGLACGLKYCNERGLNLYGKNGQSGYGLENLKSGDIQKARMIEAGTFDAHCRKLSQALLKLYESGYVNPFKEKTHTVAAKRKIGEKNAKHQRGKGNSQYGTVWIHNELLKQSKKVKADTKVPEGWKLGRKIKW